MIDSVKTPSDSSQEPEEFHFLSPQDVAIKLMEEEQSKPISNAENDDTQKIVNKSEEYEDEDEDHIDGLLSPTEEISMMEEQNPSLVDIDTKETNRVNIGNTNIDGLGSGMNKPVSTPLLSDDSFLLSDRDKSEETLNQATIQENPKNVPLPLSPPLSPSQPLPPASALPEPSSSTISLIQRYPIPNRRPKGWISSLNHPRAVSNLSTTRDHPITPPRSSSTSDITKPEVITERYIDSTPQIRGRIPSVHVHQQVRQGRRVSGAMQYAFQRQSATLDNSNDQNTEYEFGSEEDSSVIEHTSQDEEEEGIENLSPQEEARIRYQIGLSQDQDEIWMEYVRNQLSALFPDFFGLDPGNLVQPTESSVQNYHGEEQGNEDEGEGDLPSLVGDEPRHVSQTLPQADHSPNIDDNSNIETPYTNNGSPSIRSPSRRPPQLDLFSPSNSTPNHDRSYATTSTDISSLPTPPLRSNAEMLRGNVVIPNVRDEISGLREEIERLRNVVGGLAEGLGVNQPQASAQGRVAQGEDDGGDNGQEGQVENDELGGNDINTGTQDDTVQVNGGVEGRYHDGAEAVEQTSHGVTEAFIKTADQSANIIRLLHAQIRASGNHPTSQEGDEDDDQIFTSSNLERIMEYVKSCSSN